MHNNGFYTVIWMVPKPEGRHFTKPRPHCPIIKLSNFTPETQQPTQQLQLQLQESYDAGRGLFQNNQNK